MATIILMASNVFAQKHDFLQLFGYGNSSSDPLLGGFLMDYNIAPPSIYAQKRKINFDFYTGVCSDSTGHLAFYTNGISIRDTTHNRMMNGDTINPGPIWLTWQNDVYPNGPFCFSLPAPGKHNQSVFFHMATEIQYTTSPFYYTVIDMNLNGGLGAVTKKNQVILPSGHNYIAPVAVKHGNGRDWWIITGEISTPNLFTFLLDPDGVHGPFLTEMPYTFPGQEYQSINTLSPDGRTYIRCDGNHGLYIYDFDRCNGSFGELKILPFADPDFFGLATVFAPDSKHLYVSSWEGVAGLDLSAPDIAASFDTLAYFDGKASPQEPFLTGFFIPNLGPDGKIYYATTNSTLSLHVIHNPGLPGIAADVEQHGIQLSKFNNGTMCVYPNYRLGEWEGAPCDTLNGQKPGDGFVKSDWYPPARVKTPGYILLPAVGRVKPDKSARSRPHRPSMAEMAIERGKEQEMIKNGQK